MMGPVFGPERMRKGHGMNEQDHLSKLEALWKKNRPSELPPEPHYPLGEVPLTDYLRHWARETPDRPCVIFYGAELTFGQLDDLSDRFASFLAEKGLSRGDRVAVLLPNCPQFLIAFFGILKLGCVHVPVNPMFKDQEFIYEMQDTGAEVIVVLDLLYPLVQSNRDETRLREILVTRLADFLPEEPTLPLPDLAKLPAQDCPGALDFMAVLAGQSPEYPAVEIDLDDLAALNYTGGTTGMPKGCEHTQRDMIYVGATFATYSIDDLRPDDLILIYLPIFWIAGEDGGVILPVFSGMTEILLVRWDPLAVMTALDKYRVTLMHGLVDSFVELIEHPERDRFDLTSLRMTGVSSFVKKMTADYRRRWEEVSGSVMREGGYGMTETHTLDTFTTGMQKDDFDIQGRPVFVGLPMPGTRVKIVDFDTGKLLPLGEEGEIVIESPSMMRAYWNKPEETRRQLVDGWLHTGDIGMLDQEGYLYFLGRTKEMLKVKGMSVFPSEIEALLGRHPAISGSGVVGKQDQEKSEIPVAFVMLKPDFVGRVSAEEITAWCRKNMANFKVPEVRIVDQLPLTATGKVQKTELERMLD